MSCFRPLKAFRSKVVGPSGKRQLTFNPSEGYRDRPVTVPCGQCIGCRLEKSRQWAMRCYHEASLYEDNCFITLTYDDVYLPKDLSLNLRHFQLFMKRLRKRHGDGIRFFHCGEYGERLGRPHYHACIFNFDFADKELYRIHNDQRYYISNELMELWPFGFHTIGDVTFESAAYCARYITKKVTGAKAEDHYMLVDPETGEIFDRKPEYTTMSRRPGIGRGWLDKYRSDVWPSDFVVVRGVKMRPPKFYDGIYELEDFKEFRRIKRKRITGAKEFADDNTPARLKVREKVQMARFAQLKRSLESEGL